MEDISDDCIAEFVNEMSFESFSDLFLRLKIQKLKILIGKTESRQAFSNLSF